MSRGSLRDHRRARTSFALCKAPRTVAPCLGHRRSSTSAHEERLEVITKALVDTGATRVLDIGCGSGALLQRLVKEHQFKSLTGIDPSLAALKMARLRLFGNNATPKCDVTLTQGSILSFDQSSGKFDAITLVELIEHIHPNNLFKLELAMFGARACETVIMTTPNKEYNILLGLDESQVRHPDHHFEWSRFEFRRWASRVAASHRYQVDFQGIGQQDADLGSLTQMAIFRRK